MVLRGSRLIASLLVGLIFAFLTWLIMGGYRGSIGPEYGWLGYVIAGLLLPGFILGFLVGGNIHSDCRLVLSGGAPLTR